MGFHRSSFVYRRHHSCEDALTLAITRWTTALDKTQLCGAVLLISQRHLTESSILNWLKSSRHRYSCYSVKVVCRLPFSQKSTGKSQWSSRRTLLLHSRCPSGVSPPPNFVLCLPKVDPYSFRAFVLSNLCGRYLFYCSRHRCCYSLY